MCPTAHRRRRDPRRQRLSQDQSSPRRAYPRSSLLRAAAARRPIPTTCRARPCLSASADRAADQARRLRWRRVRQCGSFEVRAGSSGHRQGALRNRGSRHAKDSSKPGNVRQNDARSACLQRGTTVLFHAVLRLAPLLPVRLELRLIRFQHRLQMGPALRCWPCESPRGSRARCGLRISARQAACRPAWRACSVPLHGDRTAVGQVFELRRAAAGSASPCCTIFSRPGCG